MYDISCVLHCLSQEGHPIQSQWGYFLDYLNPQVCQIYSKYQLGITQGPACGTMVSWPPLNSKLALSVLLGLVYWEENNSLTSEVGFGQLNNRALLHLDNLPLVDCKAPLFCGLVDEVLEYKGQQQVSECVLFLFFCQFLF